MGRPKIDPRLREARGAFRKNPNREPEGKKSRRRSRKVRDYVAILSAYVEGVISGRIPACRWARLACERHVSDRRREREARYPYRFDEDLAARVLAQMERFPHIKGRWAARAQTIVLEPWQVFIVGSVFGWVRKADGLRRFREAYVEVPRKNGKSTIGSLVGLYMLAFDGEHGAEVYSGAGTERQAFEVFTPARLMVERAPEIREEAGLEVWAKALVRPADNSRFWPVVGKPGDGASPSCAIVDEYHEHLTSELVDTMVSGMGSREQPLLLVITTAGTDLASPCADKHIEAAKVLDAVAPNDEMFAIIYGVDEGDDWTRPEAIRKANPNLGVSVDEEFLLAQQRQAIANPSHQTRFRTKHLNEWISASVAGINMAAWQSAADPTLRIERFAGEEEVLALDLASKLDVCARVEVFTRPQEGAVHYYAFGRFYLPEDTIAEARANSLAYRKWVAQGHLVATPGAEIDFEAIRRDVLERKSKGKVREVVYDAWRATHLAHQLTAAGATCVEFPQAAGHMAAAFDELNAALAAGRFHHDGNPVFAWMASNTVARTIAKGLTVPSRDANRPEQKIDGIVALCMAISRWSAAKPVEREYRMFVL
jgi:phage terminase large subunit-like protein